MQPDRAGLSEMLLGTIGEALAAWWWLILVVVALGILREVVLGKRPRRKWRRRGGHWNRREHFQADALRSDASRLGDPKAQLEFISRVDFEPRRLLNKSEYGILLILEKIGREIGRGHRVMAQTCLGEIMAPQTASGSEQTRDLAFRSINSKRLDFLITDRTGMPALAVEYQGRGHYQNRAFMRDAVKREAVRKAGIQFLEVPAQYDATMLENQVRSALNPSASRATGRRRIA